MINSPPPSLHRWRFFRAGGFDQVKLESGADLLAIDQLDYKLWVALASPTSGLEFDTATLSLIDTDKDGRIRAPELIAAVKWAGSLLKNPDDLVKGATSLRVSAIEDANPAGKQAIQFAKNVLGKSEADEISIPEAAAAAQIFAAKPFNGDGVVRTDSASDEPTRALIGEVMGALGADMDANGQPGVGQAKLDQFFTDALAYSAWWQTAEGAPAILPLGPATANASAAVNSVKAKVEDYFARCRLAAFDPRTVQILNRDEKDFAALAAKELTTGAPEIAAFPLAHVQAGAGLPLRDRVNPAWAGPLAALYSDAVKPLLGERDVLSESDWRLLLSKLEPYDSWARSKGGTTVEKLGLKRVRQLLESNAKDSVAALIAQDKAEEPNAHTVATLNRLVRYHRDLHQLCQNFVSFRHFYGRKVKAIFQAGTLYLDQRSCDLCLTVEDAAKHATMAGLSGTYLAYCECARKSTGEKMQIVAAFTGGDSDNLMVGRNGVFFDRKGRDWDATITKIIDNPISIRQAFFAPYKKLVRFIEEQAAKRAAAADAAVDARFATVAKSTVAGEPIKPVEPPKQKIDTGTLAAIGLVLTTLLAAIGSVLGRLIGLPWWQIPLAFLLILLAISGPSMLMAYLKLRRRNLAPILDANGWAVNARAKINVPFGGSLTSIATLPPGSQRDLVDPFAEEKSPWPTIIVLAALLAFLGLALDRMGYLYEWSNGRIGHARTTQK